MKAACPGAEERRAAQPCVTAISLRLSDHSQFTPARRNPEHLKTLTFLAGSFMSFPVCGFVHIVPAFASHKFPGIR
jgi:hypothetical protein